MSICKPFSTTLLTMAALIASTANAQLPLPNANPSLDLRTIGRGTAAINLPDGGAIVAGQFRWIGGDTERNGLVKLRADGSIDPTWQVAATGVRAMAIDGDRLYLAGSFTSVSGVSRRGLAQVSVSTGAVAAWDPNFGSTSTYFFDEILVSGEQVYTVGDFTQVGTAARVDIVRLNATTGAMDPTWTPITNSGAALSINLTGSHAFIGGTFTQINGVPRVHLAKVDLVTGVLDGTWNPIMSGLGVEEIIVDGSDLYVSGCFSSVNSTARNAYAKLSMDGTGTLSSWNPNVVGGCNYEMSISSTHVYLSGLFSTVNGQALPKLARVDKVSGSPDTNFRPNSFGGLWNWGTLPRPNGTVLTWGEFFRIGGSYSPGLALLDNSGNLIGPPLWAEARGSVRALAAAADGGTWVGGNFLRAGTEERFNLLKLTSAGTLDATRTDVDGTVAALATADGNVFIGGSFRQIGTTTVSRLARLNSQGVPDASWNPNPSSDVVVIKPTGNDEVLIGGFFTSVGGQLRNRAARIHRQTAAVNAWNPNVTGDIASIEEDASGIYLGGTFSQVGGVARSNLAKVDPLTGALDANFTGNANGTVHSLLRGPDSTLYVGGTFNSINGLGRPGFVRLRSDTGTPDPTWNTFLGSGFIISIASGVDGLYVAGSFSSIGSQARDRLARLSHTGVVAPLFAPPIGTSSAQLQAVIEQGDRVLAGGFINSLAPTDTRQIGVMAFARNATPLTPALSITQVDPQNTQPFQSYAVSIALTAGVVGTANQPVTIEDDFGALCTVVTNAAGTGSCEMASRMPGTRQLTARYAGTTLLLAATATATQTVAGSPSTPPVNPAFDLRSTSTPVSTRLSDGSVILGGSFTRIGNTPRRGLAKLRPDGTLDLNFSADVVGSVSQVIADANDNLYVTGNFGYIDGVLRRNIAKLDANGNIVAGWTPAHTAIQTTRPAIDGNGDLIVPGVVQFVSGSPSFYRQELIKLSGANGERLGTAVEIRTNTTSTFPSTALFWSGNALYAAGIFDQANGVARRNIAKLDVNGTVDAAWNPSPNSQVQWVTGDGAGGVYLAGAFTEIGGLTTHARLARLRADGSVDTTFNAGSNGSVTELLREGNALWVTGNFTQIGGLSRSFEARLDATTGAASATFVPVSLTISSRWVGLTKVGSELCGGVFYVDFTTTDIEAMGRLCRDADTGARRATVQVSRPAFVTALARTPDGATLIGGSFVRVGSVQRNLVRISAAGLLDTGFSPVVSSVRALLVRGNGEAYIADDGLRVVRVNAAGTVDPGFTVTLNSTPTTLLATSDGLIVGGFFTSANSQPRTGIAKVDWQSGALTVWNPVLANSSGSPSGHSLATDATGAVYVGGTFTSVNGTPRLNLAKLDATGAVDATWLADSNNRVQALLVDGNDLYAGGFFNQISGQERRGIARVSTVNGGVSAWNPGAGLTNFPTVNAIARAQDGGILAGGIFNRLGGAYRSNAVKLDLVTGLADPTWNPSFDGAVSAILTGYGGTPVSQPSLTVEQNVAIGGSFEFAGSVPMPGFTAVSTAGNTPPPAERVFCSGFESGSCAPLP